MFCSNCGNNIPDGSKFCPVCGTAFAAAQAPQNPQPYQAPQYQAPQYQAPQYQQPVAPAQPEVDPYDHTEEYEAKDISENKIYAMGCYLFGILGIIIALLASKDSPYVKFHVRQAMKFTVVYGILIILMAVLCWTFIVPIAAIAFEGVLFVLQIIAFFQICKGKAKEPAILCKWKFLG